MQIDIDKINKLPPDVRDRFKNYYSSIKKKVTKNLQERIF